MVARATVGCKPRSDGSSGTTRPHSRAALIFLEGQGFLALHDAGAVVALGLQLQREFTPGLRVSGSPPIPPAGANAGHARGDVMSRAHEPTSDLEVSAHVLRAIAPLVVRRELLERVKRNEDQDKLPPRLDAGDVAAHDPRTGADDSQLLPQMRKPLLGRIDGPEPRSAAGRTISLELRRSDPGT